MIKVVCSNCGKVSLKEGELSESENLGANVSHGICPLCCIVLYGEFYDEEDIKKELRRGVVWQENDSSPFNKIKEPTKEDLAYFDKLTEDVRNESEINKGSKK